ncbi:1-acyl-sn-glycerol-3-phosphate acyltransferase [Aetokthonos hydrillicola CCALA 1050]|nr:1-acyl-sn-glycerol-3-phosphate acyltransferase [Aetokthonos hydrillicola CCALA 1050]
MITSPLSSSNIHHKTQNDTLAKANKTPRSSAVSPWFSPLAYFLGRRFLLPFFFGHIEVTGQENLPTTGPVILAPTHRSRWDALVVPYAAGRCVTGRDLQFMVTIDECQGLQGWLIRQMGGFPVDPKHPSINTLRHAVKILHDREMLVIFPEGGIHKGKLHPLKPGIARLALSAESSYPDLGVKIVPIGINYSQPYPSWGTDVNIHIGTPIKVSDYASGCLKQDAQRLTTDLAKGLQKLSHHESEILNNRSLQSSSFRHGIRT